MAGKARHGWRGDPPGSEAEARERIVGAATRCVDRYGPAKTGLSDVAAELGVTRQTVYRYFASTDDLLAAVARSAADSYLDRLARHLAQVTDPVDVVVEALAFTIERLPEERYLSVLLTPGRSGRFFAGVTSPEAIAFAHSLLERTAVDWEKAGYGRAELDELGEFALRMLQSLVLDPGTPRRSGSALRGFLRRWAAPAIACDAAEGTARSRRPGHMRPAAQP